MQHAPGVPVIARVFEDSEAEIIRARGGIPVSNADAAVDTFMQWFEKTGFRKRDDPDHEHATEQN